MKKIIPSDAILIPDSAEKVFTGQIFDVYQWQQKLFDETEATFEMLKRPDTVVAICVIDGHILVVEDEQPHSGSRLSFPGGRVDETDISIEAAAKREVLEETGYTFKNWRVVKVSQPQRKLEWFVYVLLAWDIENNTMQNVDPGEKISVQPLTFLDLKTQVMNNIGYLGDASDLLDPVNNLDELLQMPEYVGEPVTR